ncbi:MAG: hypothetical protein K8S87_12580, partial [Planctomycetes bacterium]|nr:hypothetical protein [Planctomycetota bacterium]
MVKTSELILVVLVIICSLLIYEVAFDNDTNYDLEKAYAGGGAGNQDLLVVPFFINSNEEKLAVFKKEDIRYKNNKLSGEWCMAIYGMRDGRNLKFEASRWIGNDFFLKDYGIDAKKKSKMHPETLREYKEKGT